MEPVSSATGSSATPAGRGSPATPPPSGSRDEVGLRELVVPILTDNAASRGLVEACGYTLLGDGPELAPGRPSVRYGKALALD
jgi:hypothetical protein